MIIGQIGTPGGPLVPTGIGLGSMIAALCSWERNRSIFWAILAAFLSWFYVGYYLLTRPSKAREYYPPVPKYPLGVQRDRVLHPASDK
ncbi:MAG TPA: hypothetical protein VFE51_23925 [Verrucomicrobiae bacterium]|nr:hypothetical protein [Verrucomicrobiae bacterium]